MTGSWVSCGPLGASWSTLGGLLEPLWVLLGGSWGLLGAPGAAPGRHTRTLSDARKTHTRTHENMPKKTQLPHPSTQFPPRSSGGLWRLKIDQNRIQNGSKFKTIFKSEKNALQEPLGAVLGRSWAILEAILGPKIALRYWNS